MNSISINQNIYRGLEIYATEHNVSIQEIIEKCLSRWLSKTAKVGRDTAHLGD